MHLITILQQTFREMWLRKLRLFMALFCIMFGTVTVIMLLSLGQGFHDASFKNMMDIVDGSFFISSGVTSKSFHGIAKGKPVHIKADDIALLPSIVPEVQLVTPILVSKTSLGYKTHQNIRDLYGVSPDFRILRKINIESGGRFVNFLDIQKKSRVVIVGHKLKTLLFGDDNPIGKKILINSVPFTLVGVIRNPTKNIYNFYDNSALIPYPAFNSLYGKMDVAFFSVLPKNYIDDKTFEYSLRSYFAHKYNYDKNDLRALNLFNTAKNI